MKHGNQWRGGRFYARGYVYVWGPAHSLANANGYVLEHRKVLFDAGLFNGDPKLHVHHKNGVKDDNRIENLEVLTASQHNREHRSEKCPRCGGSRWAMHRNAGDVSAIQRRCMDCEAAKQRELRRRRRLARQRRNAA